MDFNIFYMCLNPCYKEEKNYITRKTKNGGKDLEY